MSRSINKAMILGNLTRDPEMRYTPQGNAVTNFTVATNRQWTTEGGETKEDAEFHNVVAWNKLAELCSQLLSKGTKVYIEGRLQTRTWDDQQGVRHYKTEIIADDMIVLSPRASSESAPAEGVADERKEEKETPSKEKESKDAEKKEENVATEEIPF